ncbi:MAG: hypothetical protein K5707_05655, partial [Clostridia bacterium]|nr:hypothetical protein [Clostridia bacterium]
QKMMMPTTLHLCALVPLAAKLHATNAADPSPAVGIILCNFCLSLFSDSPLPSTGPAPVFLSAAILIRRGSLTLSVPLL